MIIYYLSISKVVLFRPGALTSREVLGHKRFQKLTEIQRRWREERQNYAGAAPSPPKLTA